MHSLKALAYDCRRATRLIEKKQFEGISLRHNLQLRYHLAGCDGCRLYQQQSLMISRAMREMVDGAAAEVTGLTQLQKEQMQGEIEGRLGKG